MRTLNLGILAHVDAGKTTLTERLLHSAGAIPRLGSVDAGTTQTDSLALERQRGITIRSAVVAFTVGDLTVNLIDTPGHPDFIAEVDRSLRVLDGAVLVISAVEGVQAQTVVLMRALRRLRVPTLLFVNKIDRGGADPERVLTTVRERLTADVFPLGGSHDVGGPTGGYVPDDLDDLAVARRWLEVLAEHDDTVLAAYVDDREAAWGRVRLEAALAAQTAACLAYPLVLGSAVTGAGTAELTTAIATLLPAATGDHDTSPSGWVFKVDRGPGGDRRAWVRMTAGTLRVRDRVPVGTTGSEKVATITGLDVVEPGGPVVRGSVGADRIAVVAGLQDVQVGDWVGSVPDRRVDAGFTPPTLETAVLARDPAQQGALHVALTQLAEQDPLIDVRQDDDHHQLFVSLFGAVQQEVLEQTLAADFGIAVDFHATTVLCVERPAGPASAVRRMGEPGNPYAATIGVTVEPGPVGRGSSAPNHTVRVTAALLDIPLYVYQTTDAFDAAVTGYVEHALRRGPAGWPVHDCLVTVTESGYSAPSTRSRDVRKATELVVADALSRAGTVVCEPVDAFELEGPADAMTAVLALLSRHGASLDAPVLTAAWFTVRGEIPAAEVQAVQQRLSGRTHGEGVLQVEFARYAPVQDRRSRR